MTAFIAEVTIMTLVSKYCETAHRHYLQKGSSGVLKVQCAPLRVIYDNMSSSRHNHHSCVKVLCKQARLSVTVMVVKVKSWLITAGPDEHTATTPMSDCT